MKCPYCGEEIKDEAKKCRFCGEWIGREVAATSEIEFSANRLPDLTLTHPAVNRERVTKQQDMKTPYPSRARVSNNGIQKPIATVIIIAAILGILFIPMVPSNITYNEVESYERPAEYRVVSVEATRGLSSGSVTAKITLENVDKEDGIFTPLFDLYIANQYKETKEVKVLVRSGQREDCHVTFGTRVSFWDWPNNSSWQYRVQPPTVIDQEVVKRDRIVYKPLAQVLVDMYNQSQMGWSGK